MKLLRANTHIRFFNKREDEKKNYKQNFFLSHFSYIVHSLRLSKGFHFCYKFFFLYCSFFDAFVSI